MKNHRWVLIRAAAAVVLMLALLVPIAVQAQTSTQAGGAKITCGTGQTGNMLCRDMGNGYSYLCPYNQKSSAPQSHDHTAKKATAGHGDEGVFFGGAGPYPMVSGYLTSD